MAIFTGFSLVAKDRPLKGEFVAQDVLKANGWRPQIETLEAEKLLKGKPTFTYLTRPNQEGRGFYVSFVAPSGRVEHHVFSLIDAKYGIWRNYLQHHVGKLEKVLCDSMGCELTDLKPLV
jgi:hypothetical protein